jgi:hypothetical protein
MAGTFFVICMIIMLVRRFPHRHAGWVGGKIGRWRATPAEVVLPGGFSDVISRDITLLGARSTDATYPSLGAFLRNNSFKRTEVMRIYRVSSFKTQIEIPTTPPDYERIDAASALALLRELPDPRLIRRLQLSDEPSFFDPWLRQKGMGLLGHATTSGLVVLYRPDRRQTHQLCITLLHEWLHLVAFKSRMTLRHFKRADAVESPASLSFSILPPFNRRLRNHEVWSELGERIVGADEVVAREAALTAPLHSMILWQQVEGIFCSVPTDLQSTRLAELQARAAFMKSEVAPKARALARWWK